LIFEPLDDSDIEAIFYCEAFDDEREAEMEAYRVQEVKLLESGGVAKRLREYELPASDPAAVTQLIRHFFEMEMMSPRALLTIDFDALLIIGSRGEEIARFSVADFWKREAYAVDAGIERLHDVSGPS